MPVDRPQMMGLHSELNIGRQDRTDGRTLMDAADWRRLILTKLDSHLYGRPVPLTLKSESESKPWLGFSSLNCKQFVHVLLWTG